MPYIPQSDRFTLDYYATALTVILLTEENFDSHLNYIISTIMNGLLHENVSYAKVNKLIGVLECAKLELYRRIASPYEDEKCESNGDVYDLKRPTFW